MKNLFDSYIIDVLTQLTEDVSNITPDIVNSFKDVLKPLANNQNIDANTNPSIDKNRLAAAINAGIINQNNDGTHTVSDAAIAHISPEDPDIGGKFTPTQQAAGQPAPIAAPLKTQSSSATTQKTAQPQQAASTSTNNAGVVSNVYSPNKR